MIELDGHGHPGLINGGDLDGRCPALQFIFERKERYVDSKRA